MNGDTVKVLVVDDTPAAREKMVSILEDFGYSCVTAQDGIDALEKLDSETFQLLVTDLDMPRLDGLSLIENVRMSHPGLPIIMMTARSDVETAHQALKLGVADYLVKPIEHAEEAQAAARRAVQNAGTRDEPDALAWELSGKRDDADEPDEETSSAAPVPGEPPRIRGYRIQELIGKGGTATVFKALQVATQRVVALKVLPFFEGSDQVLTCLLREAHVAARLQHPNIMRGYDAGVDGGFFYVAIEFIEGESLGDKVDREGALFEPRALEITRQIAGALVYAWEVGLVHRDIKPDNIILAKDGTAKLADLGVTRDVTGLLTTISTEGMVIGTPLYISPEQAQGLGNVDWRADVYGLGATLYHMVCGVPPFDSNLGATTLLYKHASEEPIPAHQKNASVNMNTSLLIGKMMRKDPEQRYTNPRQLLTDCERVSHGLAPEEFADSTD